MQRFSPLWAGLIIVGCTAAALLVHGYHYNIEDQAIYLPGIKKLLDPSLYQRDADFFVPQTHSTLLTSVIAATARLTRLDMVWVSFLWHVGTLLAYFGGCWAVLAKIAPPVRGRIGGMALMTALLTLPVAGTSLYLVDQYLHPRTLATALVLVAVALMLDRVEPSSAEHKASIDFGMHARRFQFSTLQVVTVVAIIVIAATVHVMMAFFGALLIVALALPSNWRMPKAAAFAVLPLQELFQPATPEWVEAARTRSQHYVLQWQWYEWLGVVAPPFVLWAMASFADKRGLTTLATLCRRTAYFAGFSLAVGVAFIPRAFERLTPYQPLRMFHLVYIVMVLAAGVLAAEFWMKSRPWRWAAVVLPLAGVMFYAQRDLFEYSAHVEWPSARERNEWVQAFNWVRDNTPKDAYFALDPHYPSTRGEDYHGFRGIAERSQVADWDKDGGVVSLFPKIGPRWHNEVHEILGWNKFNRDDFQRIHRDLGVDWVVVARATMANAPNSGATSPIVVEDCPYQNASVYVCRLR